MTSNTENNKRIVKNTSLLYIRMLLMMVVSLFTSRIILQALGIIDFGIYNVVGGIVAMLGFINSTLNTAIQRYLNFEMGNNNIENMKKVFSMSLISIYIIAILALIISETVGLWFVSTKLVIPADRYDAALIVYHFSVLTFVTNILMVPYNASIIAHEKMSIYAYISIFEVILRLLLTYLLIYINNDKLILYSILMFSVSLLIAIIYKYVCKKQFEECRFKYIWDLSLLKKLFSFSGWMLFGTIANISCNQGVNILINLFFGPSLNAARGVSMQVYNAINQFSVNFLTAIRPQIIKSYAQSQFNYMFKLVFISSKCSFFLLLILVTPLILNANLILNLWLNEVPQQATLFTQLILIDLLIISLNSPITYVSHAIGKIKSFQISISVIYLLTPLLTWIAYKSGAPAVYTFYILILCDLIGVCLRVVLLKRILNSFPIKKFFFDVLAPTSLICCLTFGFCILLNQHIILSNIFTNFIFHCTINFILTLSLIYILGLSKEEKITILQYISIKLKK